MKRPLFFFAFLCLSICSMSQPQISNISYPTSVNLFGLYEVSFTLGHYSNPYDPDTIAVYAVFTGPDNSSFTVNGFYYEGYTFQQVNGHEVATASPATNGWRIRFTPTIAGTWSFCVHAIDKDGETTTSFRPLGAAYTFNCLPVSNGDGFISKANSKFLKREIVRNGFRQNHSFFPVGPNVAWYECSNLQHPKGIYDYEKYVDSLDGKGNYMRLWINRFHSISLYGPEYTQQVGGQPTIYFDSTLNQKDAAELDHIITYAAQHDISVMLSIFTFGDFKYADDIGHVSVNVWENNPFNTILDSPCQFFSDEDALRITKNLIRYIIARWGYATNLLCWEFWNEVEKVFQGCDGYSHIEQDALDWHQEIRSHVLSNDTYNHLTSTSLAGKSSFPYFYSEVFQDFDFVQIHRYGDAQNAEIKRQIPLVLFDQVVSNQTQYPSKPVFVGEFGFKQGNSTHREKDPFGINLHNSIWSSMFSSAMGTASFWWWPYVDACALYGQFKPLLDFCDGMPILSESYTPHHTGEFVGNDIVFPNGLPTFSMMNTNQDSIYGWSQDTAFSYPSLRRLTDSVVLTNTDWGPRVCFKDNAVFDSLGYVYTLDPSKRPGPSSSSNSIIIPVTNQPVGTTYRIRWYNTESGSPYAGWVNYVVVHQDSMGNKYVSIQFPSLVRDLQQHSVNNTYCDAVFSLIKYNPIKK